MDVLEGFRLEMGRQVKHLLETPRQVMPRAPVRGKAVGNAVEKEGRDQSRGGLRVELMGNVCFNHEFVFH